MNEADWLFVWKTLWCGSLGVCAWFIVAAILALVTAKGKGEDLSTSKLLAAIALGFAGVLLSAFICNLNPTREIPLRIQEQFPFGNPIVLWVTYIAIPLVMFLITAFPKARKLIWY